MRSVDNLAFFASPCQEWKYQTTIMFGRKALTNEKCEQIIFVRNDDAFNAHGLFTWTAAALATHLRRSSELSSIALLGLQGWWATVAAFAVTTSTALFAGNATLRQPWLCPWRCATR